MPVNSLEGFLSGLWLNNIFLSKISEHWSFLIDVIYFTLYLDLDLKILYNWWEFRSLTIYHNGEELVIAGDKKVVKFVTEKGEDITLKEINEKIEELSQSEEDHNTCAKND